MVRAPCVDKNGMKKGAWSEEEDHKLRVYIQRYGHWNWRELPKFAGLSRCGKSCRLRWMNYLRPNVKRGNYTKEEEDLVIKLHQELGNKWSAIAAKLPGRSDNEIKNHWHTHLKKSTKQSRVASKEEQSTQVASEEQQSSKQSTRLASEVEQTSDERIIDFSTGGQRSPDLSLSSSSDNRLIDQSLITSEDGLDLQLSLCLNYS